MHDGDVYLDCLPPRRSIKPLRCCKVSGGCLLLVTPPIEKDVTALALHVLDIHGCDNVPFHAHTQVHLLGGDNAARYLNTFGELGMKILGLQRHLTTPVLRMG